MRETEEGWSRRENQQQKQTEREGVEGLVSGGGNRQLLLLPCDILALAVHLHGRGDAASLGSACVGSSWLSADAAGNRAINTRVVQNR